MESFNNEQLRQLHKLRRWLHQHPELSGKELQSARYIEEFLNSESNPSKIITSIAGNGLAALYVFNHTGPTILIRAELDALPINESNTFLHKSLYEGIAHKCGHDGHMSILAGLAVALKNRPMPAGRIVLYFQPEEESGKGALSSIEDEAFKMFVPDYVIALHNLPGFAQGSIIIKEGAFSSASTGMIIKIKGASSHAAFPEQGISPEPFITGAIEGFKEIPGRLAHKFDGFTQSTIVHINLGEKAFGTSPGNAMMMATLRASGNNDLIMLKKETERMCRALAEDNRLRIEISYTEEFPAIINHPELNHLISTSATDLDFEIITLSEPLRWSEDFGHFTSRFKGAMFGLGAGTDVPGLHTEDYDFPDEIITHGIELFYRIAGKLINGETRKIKA
jgi:amidohydrolase